MTNREQNRPGNVDDPAEKLFLHLQQHPFDLVDTTRLMRSFCASADDMRRALGKLEQSTLSYEEEPVC
ncbi:MAG: hypothetical protein HYZ50_13325 [Deltaproteobacteria bacterium]|nr:hypothetical protein [Deltaproteobacteria bacterium]